MKQRTFLIVFVLLIIEPCIGQISLVKKNLSELFFEIHVSPTKFDVRKVFHSDDNFFNYGGDDLGEYETISAKFKRNLKLSYLGRDDKSIIFWFNEGTEISDSRKIYTEYFSDEYNLCLKQLNELFSIFNRCSFKSEKTLITNSKEEKSGEGWDFYSSEKSFKDEKPYLNIHYRYIKLKSIEGGYIFEIVFSEDNLY